MLVCSLFIGLQVCVGLCKLIYTIITIHVLFALIRKEVTDEKVNAGVTISAGMFYFLSRVQRFDGENDL